jgi:RimJ/RimL family protein N-acetyltransferase
VAVVNHVLHTQRLILRPVTADDHAVLLAHWAAPDVRRFLFDGATLAAAEITEAIEDSTRDFGRAGYGLWLVHELGGTDLVGTAGLRPLEDLGLEIFYSLAPGSWGKGYATEAARAVLEHALGPLGLPEVLAEVDEGNTASIAIIERLGMTPFDVVPGLLGPMTRGRGPCQRPQACCSGGADPLAEKLHRDRRHISFVRVLRTQALRTPGCCRARLPRHRPQLGRPSLHCAITGLPGRQDWVTGQ